VKKLYSTLKGGRVKMRPRFIVIDATEEKLLFRGRTKTPLEALSKAMKRAKQSGNWNSQSRIVVYEIKKKHVFTPEDRERRKITD